MADSKATLTVATAFAAAMLAAPATYADAVAAIDIASGSESTPQPSPAALERLEEAAQLTFWWMPIFPPKFVDLWPEVTHVETIRTA